MRGLIAVRPAAMIRASERVLGENAVFPAVRGIRLPRSFLRRALLVLSAAALAGCSALPPAAAPGSAALGRHASGTASRSFPLPAWQVRIAAISALTGRSLGIAALGSTDRSSTILARGPAGTVKITLRPAGAAATDVTVDAGGDAALAQALLRDIARVLGASAPAAARA